MKQEISRFLNRKASGGISALASQIHNFHKSFEKNLESLKTRAVQEAHKELCFSAISEFDERKFKSIDWGFTIRRDGSKYGDIDEYLDDLEGFERRYQFYFRLNRKEDGTYCQKRERVKGDVLKKGTITLSGLHSAQLEAIDRKKHNLEGMLLEESRELMDQLEQLAPLKILTWTCHPEDGCVHFHYVYVDNGDDGLKLKRLSLPGNPRIRHLEQAAVSCLRLNDMGLWPDEETVNYRLGLSKELYEVGQYPHNYLASRMLDRSLDRFIEKTKNRDEGDMKILMRVEEDYRSRIALRAQSHLVQRRMLEKTFDDMDEIRELVKHELNFLQKANEVAEVISKQDDRGYQQRFEDLVRILNLFFHEYANDVSSERKDEKKKLPLGGDDTPDGFGDEDRDDPKSGNDDMPPL